ncbi:hypothetical protein L484_016451 [Morus notabilis]|uniref:Uncharacterized protein n=1 Tax=Morus notabilis TaxID=981085 RepID=W9RK21_9ROSA|nr:hypothetical protein L484_016451 [Morus notabilis]
MEEKVGLGILIGGGAGDGESGGGGGGDGEEEHWDWGWWRDSYDLYYRKMINKYSGNALFLGNYAKLLKEWDAGDEADEDRNENHGMRTKRKHEYHHPIFPKNSESRSLQFLVLKLANKMYIAEQSNSGNHI